MLSRLAIATLLIFFVFISSFAQGLKTGSLIWTGEFEFTHTQGGKDAGELYVFGNNDKINLLGEGLYVEDGVRRGELALGKTIVLSKLLVKPYAGLTSNGAVFTPAVIVLNFREHTAVYIADPKFYYNGSANTLYQKASLALTKSGGWQLRWECFQVRGVSTVFNRLGIERRIRIRSSPLGDNSHIQISPFVDTANRRAGLAVGIRWP